MISSYDREATRPLAGTLWVWEPEKPHAVALIRVTGVRWNGEEWFVQTTTIAAAGAYPGDVVGAVNWNDLGRFWEAAHRVSRRATASGTPGVTRKGAPQPDEQVSA
jgi:hypothetical protein